MNNLPLISVCIPAFNAASFLPETLHSVLDQTYENLEVVVVDDGSTDNTESVVKQIQDSRLIYMRQPNRGSTAARNQAFSRSKGDYIKFLDADDLLNATCIEEQAKRLSGNTGCVASAKWGRFYNNDMNTFLLSPEKVWRDMKGVDWLVESLIDSGGNMMQPGIFLIPRSLIYRSGMWNESLSLIDDFEFMCRILINSDQVLFCQEALLKYRSGVAGSLSSRKERVHMQSAFRSLELGLGKLIEASPTKKTRTAAANTYQRWAFQFYPEHKDLLKAADARIRTLGGATIGLEGGRLLRLLSKVIGWQAALRLKQRIQ